MLDITKCRGTGCVLKNECYRYTAKPDKMQSFFVKPPLEDDGTCGYFWRKKKMRRRGKEK
jgi:hypothetical protein